MTSARSLRLVRARKHRVPRGFAGPIAAPLAGALDLGRSCERRRLLTSALIAITVHGCMAVVALDTPDAPPPPRRELPIVVAARPVPPPASPPTPPKPEVVPPKREPRPLLARRTPPAAAQAGKVITRAAAPSEPMDMTAFSMVTGQAQGYAGGVSASDGKSATAVADLSAQAHVAPGPRDPGPNLSAPAEPLRTDWSCAWPDDEQEGDLRDARVVVRVRVNRDGEPEAVDVSQAPKPSFAEAARRCALSESYRPALDPSGARIAGGTRSLLVHFVR